MVERFAGRAVFTTSFGLEDQAIAHAIASAHLPVRMVTLDTGRLFEETHTLHARTRARYGIPIEAFFPDSAELQTLLAAQGPNGFYDSVANRHACCQVRKVAPLARALAGAELWITGIRREQSASRAARVCVEGDAQHQLLKFHPLLDVTGDDLWQYVTNNSVPTNPLHDRGFVSIGCAPCTRAIAAGQPARSGRWWWESEEPKECGLHLQSGQLVRSKGSNS